MTSSLYCFAVLQSSQRLVALWILPLHASGMHSHFLCNDEQANTEEDRQYNQRPYQTGQFEPSKRKARCL